MAADVLEEGPQHEAKSLGVRNFVPVTDAQQFFGNLVSGKLVVQVFGFQTQYGHRMSSLRLGLRYRKQNLLFEMMRLTHERQEASCDNEASQPIDIVGKAVGQCLQLVTQFSLAGMNERQVCA